jgi:16S rRNA (cytosine967-C5)-methyltransferase
MRYNKVSEVTMKINARKVILEILDDCDRQQFSNKLIQDMYKNKDIPTIDKGFISKIVYGVIENKLYLDFVIRKFSSVRLKKIEPSILNILRMSAYQFIYLDKTPDSAVVNEAVKLTKKASFRHSGFVNGLLRNLMRDFNKVQLPNKEKETVSYLSIKYSHPEWLVDRWLGVFGLDFTEELLSANNQTPNLSIRVNTLKTNREDLMTNLTSMGISCEKSDIVEDGIIITDSKPLSLNDNEAFVNGLFTVQDESSMKVSELLAPKAGEHVLDLCAAPGGKSTHMSQLMEGKGQVIACDLTDKKLVLIKENINRLGLKNIQMKVNDATLKNESFLDRFDKVLVDAPCSGLGIIRRKPDIKYQKSLEDLVALKDIQTKIIEQASSYVKSGGVLMYSTCTIEENENRKIVDAFLASHPEFSILPFEDQEDLQLYPNVHGTDGFYCCKLKRK